MRKHHVEAVKIGLVLVAGFVIYQRVNQARQIAEKVVTESLNPMSRNNLANIAAEKIVGPENIQSGFSWLFDKIDSAAEALGSETGINGIPGTNAEQLAKMQAKTAGRVTAFGANANG